tara:strand:- start:694 stop:1692 length:999 start_codon:yes stop_codon:yes gene_type:complete
MIVDSFLFFNELDLLEIRLEYLYPIVDKFLIVEAGQSFKGNIKKFNFEDNIKRYSKYLDKIYYFKIKDIYFDEKEFFSYINKNNNAILKKISHFINSHNHYDKNNLSYLLDTYHRECIHIALNKLCKKKDLILISDLDEIPSYYILKKIKNINNIKDPIVFIQKEFQFFFNNFSNKLWYGSILANYEFIEKQSLNQLRIDSHKFISLKDSGYHFTSLGDINYIKNKIENYAHQEFNNNFIKKNIEKNISHGKDIFFRFGRSNNNYVDLNHSNLIDKRLYKIISKYNLYFLKKLNKNLFYDIKYKIYQFSFLFYRAFINPKKVIIKLKNMIIY